MSRWTYTPIGVWDNRDPAVANQLFTDLAAATADVDATNFAEQGLDEEVFANRPLEQEAAINGSTQSAFTAVGWTQFALGVTTFRTSALAALADANEWYRIRSWAWWNTRVGVNLLGVPTNTQMGMRHVWNNGTTTAQVGGGQQWFGQAAGAFSGDHRSMFIESYLQGPQPTVSWVELQYQITGGGTCHANRAVLQVDKMVNTARVT